jgi:hypothetical protein
MVDDTFEYKPLKSVPATVNGHENKIQNRPLFVTQQQELSNYWKADIGFANYYVTEIIRFTPCNNT